MDLIQSSVENKDRDLFNAEIFRSPGGNPTEQFSFNRIVNPLTLSDLKTPTDPKKVDI